ncbi:MAG TPA: putative DNA-binding domain-containing protein [Methylophilaceae bacterium]|nr:putative DNA-binding domain-containing protein [Methylophilaceae bacterium]
MNVALPSFQQYQLQFTKHIRNPKGSPRPPKVPAKRMQVYTEIVFNGLESSVAACFPVAKKVLGARTWKKLIRGFFIHHQCHSPLFRQIPEEFLRYLEAAQADPEQTLPSYLKSLAHYEWIELALAVADVSIDMATVDVEGDLLEGAPVLAPALALLSYDYPVQLISPRFKPKAPLTEPVHLLVFRDAADDVQFIEINQVTARLLTILQTEAVTGRQALEKIATEMAHPDPQVIVRFGQSILADLKAQGVILGARALT